MRDLDVEKAGGGIDENDGAAAGAHQPDSLAEDELERLLRIERGVKDVADLLEQVQPHAAFF